MKKNPAPIWIVEYQDNHGNWWPCRELFYDMRKNAQEVAKQERQNLGRDHHYRVARYERKER